MWPENWDIVVAFGTIASQLHVVTIGGGMAPGKPHYVGLRYADVKAGLRGAEIKADAELWAGIRIMEAAFCGKLNGLEPPYSDVTTDGA